jgi:acid phosphatase (class B)
MDRNRNLIWLLAAVAACASHSNNGDAPLIDDSTGKADDGQPRSMNCYTTQPAGTLVKVTFTPNGNAFDVDASADDTTMFSVASQRPSLNAYVEDGTSDVPNEFVDFRQSGLDALPPIGMPQLELPLATGPKALRYADPSTMVQLECTVSAPKLLDFLGITPVESVNLSWASAVGFDIDDTLLFSTPAFGRGFATGGTPAPTDVTFWTATNGCDAGCPAETITLPDGTTKDLPANDASTVKAKALELVSYHQSLGQQVYAITARPDTNGDPLRAYLHAQFGIDSDHVFFEPNGKTDRMAMLALDAFYGDADTDITDSAKVPGRTVLGIRSLRSPKSSYRSGGRLAKYHPGYYGEPILADSYE